MTIRCDDIKQNYGYNDIVPPVAKIFGKNKTRTYAYAYSRNSKYQCSYIHADMFLMIFGRTELIISASKAKNYEESFGELRFCVAAQKPGKNHEKRLFETDQKMSTKKFGAEKSNVGNRLKRVFPEFQADRSLVHEVNDCSKFSKKIEIREIFFPFIFATDGTVRQTS